MGCEGNSPLCLQKDNPKETNRNLQKIRESVNGCYENECLT